MLPTSRSRSRIAALAVAALAAATIGVTTRPEPAQAACTSAAVFSPWGDPAQYSLVLSGSLETTYGWTLAGGAALASGNEPWRVSSAYDSHSLVLPSGASAATQVPCLGLAYPQLRFFARNTGASTATLKVNASYRDQYGVKHTTTLAHLSAGSTWKPTSPLRFLDPGLPIIAQTAGQVSFTFVAEGTGGKWQIDDVYVDPFRHF